MTTTVKVEAHCNNGMEVVVESLDGKFGSSQVLQDGESTVAYAYDAKMRDKQAQHMRAAEQLSLLFEEIGA